MSDLRLIAAPSIYLVGSPEVRAAELGRFLADNGSPDWRSDAPSEGELLVEVAGRGCYNSFGKPRPGGNAAYIGHILEAGHGSVCEHAAYSFIITGVSRSLSHELVRHRAGMSYSQLSQRFIDESDVAFVVPPALLGPVSRTMEALNSCPAPHTGQVYLDRDSWWADDREIGHRWLEACEYARRKYVVLVDWLEEQADRGPDVDRTSRRKAAREAARSVLPNCTETLIFITGNARALRNVFEQRGVMGADAEIRRLAVAWCRVMKAAAPSLFGDFAVQADAATGSEYLTFDHRKV